MNQYELVLVYLDPTIGSEIRKTRPCVIVSPMEMNVNLNTVIVVPITSNKRKYPTRVRIAKSGVTGMAAVDQIRTIDKRRIIKQLGQITTKTSLKLKVILKELLID